MASRLSKIKTSGSPAPPRVVLVGDSGVGKTTCALAAYRPVLLGTEDGTGLLEVPCFPIAKDYDDVIESIRDLTEQDHDYRTAIIDSIDGVEHLIDEKVCEKHGKEFMSDFAYYRGNVESVGRMESLFHDLDNLRTEKNMQIILISHAVRVTVEDPIIGAYDRMEPNLYKKAVPLLVAWADIVAYMDFEKAIQNKGDKESSRTVRTAKKSKANNRVLHFLDDGSYIAKNRRGLPDKMDVAIGEGWGAVEKAMKAAEKKENSKK